MEHEQTPESQPHAGNVDPGSEEAAALAFETRETETESKDEAQSEPADETQADDSDEDLGDETPEDDTETQAEYVEVEIDGKTFKVPPEVQKATLRQADYSRKMNEVSAKDKLVAQRMEAIEAMEKTAEKRAEVLAEAKALDAQIAQYDGVDWAKAKAEDPAGAALAAVELMQLRQRRGEIDSKARTVESEFDQERGKLLQSQLEEMDKALTKSLKGWGDELGKTITKYALESGWTLEKLQRVTDPQVVIALDKARRFDALQSSKEAVKAKAKDAPPVIKPGAPRKSDAKSETLDRLRKSGSVDDAAAAFLSRMN